jgi:hypothetical protein
MEKSKLTWWKLVAVWILFLLLHFSYDTFPNIIFEFFGETAETTFTHMKMLFYAYLFASVIEYFLNRKSISNLETFVYARLFIAVAYPWLAITIWFTAEAITGNLLPTTLEIIYANITTLIGIYIALRIEELFEGVTLRPAFKGSVILLFLTALISYTAFSFNPPQHFFTPPEDHLH